MRNSTFFRLGLGGIALVASALVVLLYGHSGHARIKTVETTMSRAMQNVEAEIEPIEHVATLGNLGYVNYLNVVGNYVFMTGSSGTSGNLNVVDVTNPFSPVHVISTPFGSGDFSIVDSNAFIGDGQNGLRIVNISNPLSPSLMSTVDTPGSAMSAAYKGGYAYVADLTWGLRTVDARVITSPVPLGYEDSFYDRGLALSIVATDTTIYLGCVRGIQVYDITNSAAPSRTTSIVTARQVDGLTVAEGKLFASAYSAGLLIYDLSDPKHPTELGSIAAITATQSVDVKGNLLYIVDYGGLSIFDISNPVSPTLKAVDRSFVGYNDVKVVGDLVFVAAENLGLKIFRYSPSPSPIFTPTPTVTPTLTPTATPTATPTETPTVIPTPSKNFVFVPVVRR